MHILLQGKKACIYYFSQEPTRYCTCDQWIMGAMAGFCRRFLQLSVQALNCRAGGTVNGLQVCQSVVPMLNVTRAVGRRTPAHCHSEGTEEHLPKKENLAFKPNWGISETDMLTMHTQGKVTVSLQRPPLPYSFCLHSLVPFSDTASTQISVVASLEAVTLFGHVTMLGPTNCLLARAPSHDHVASQVTGFPVPKSTGYCHQLQWRKKKRRKKNSSKGVLARYIKMGWWAFAETRSVCPA